MSADDAAAWDRPKSALFRRDNGVIRAFVFLAGDSRHRRAG